MKRSFRISFTRKADAYETEHTTCGWADQKNLRLFDETEFDTEYLLPENVYSDLFNLFMNFVAENNMKEVFVYEIIEVPYDGGDTHG